MLELNSNGDNGIGYLYVNDLFNLAKKKDLFKGIAKL